MRFGTLAVGVLLLGTVAFAQTAEFGVSGGESRFANSGLLGVLPKAGPSLTSPEDVNISQDNGFRLSFHMTLNTGRFFGHEVGYAYNRSQLVLGYVPAGSAAGTAPTVQKTGMGVHQGFYDFLLYGMPEGKKIRPFVAGGGGFDSFPFPGYSVTSGATITKFGFNYGAGVKVRVSQQFLIRFDYREYMCGKPNYFGSGVQINQSGLLRQQVFTTGFAFVM